jgi:hypothetical protein
MTHAPQILWMFKPRVLWGGMGSILTRQRITAALIALFVTVLVLVPTVDAVACSAELEPPHAAQVVDSDPADADDVGAVHGVCSHGHCHHAASVLNSSADYDPSARVGVALRSMTGDDLLASRVPGGPERPPRV